MQKYTSAQADEVEKLVKPIYARIKNWAHGWLHVKNVAKAAEDLAKLEGVDPVLCKIAGYCHDLGRVDEEERGLVNPEPLALSHHAEFSVRSTREILQKVGIKGGDADQILEAVRVHNKRKYLGENKIAIILQDADRTDGFGKLAMLRFASFNCEMPVEEPQTDEDIDRELGEIKEMFKRHKKLCDKMVGILEYAFGWIDELANTESVKDYIKEGYEFNKKFLEEIESY